MSLPGFTSQQELDLYYLLRNAEWRAALDGVESLVIADMRRMLDKYHRKLERELRRLKPGDVTYRRLLNLMDGMEVTSRYLERSGTPRELMGLSIAMATGQTMEASLSTQYNILSVGGAARNVRAVSSGLGATEFAASFLDTPVGENPLLAWVDKAFEAGWDVLRAAINKGWGQGEGYPKLVRRVLRDAENATLREATAMVRTYVQSGATAAQMAVYQANADIIDWWEWNAILEPGYKKNGRGTCLRCSSLDGQRWRSGDKRKPKMPLHVNCRCLWLPVIDWTDIGISESELERAARPYTIRPDENIGTGGTREILDGGQTLKSWGGWAAEQGEEFKRNALGPERYKLWREWHAHTGGTLESFINKLVNRKTGALLKLKELEARL